MRESIPSPEELKKLPPDGGPEFNRLVFEQSPYLLQHAGNPVDWYPWGAEAFRKARDEDKPIFLSIGYSTCHWCHVMERESFEDPEVAELMNATFVNIKVDREERPDIDNIYMGVCQAMTGGGGWPLTIIMTPDKKPFFAGTYFPKEGRFGRAGMLDLVPRLALAWKTSREQLLDSAEKITTHVRSMSVHATGEELGLETLKAGYEQLAARFDAQHGGFGSAPKFPSPHDLTFLLRYWKRSGEQHALRMVEKTLQAMRAGGMYDRSVSMLMPSPHKEHHDEHIARHLRTGEVNMIGIGRERQGRRSDGTVFPLEVAVSEVRLTDRRLFVGIFRDITERKRAEDALVKSRSFLQTVIDAVPEALMVIDRDYRIVLANRAVRELAGGRDPVSRGLKCYQVSHHRDSPCHEAEHPCPLEQVASTKAPLAVTHTHFNADGNEVLMEIVAGPILNEAGEVVQIIESCRDVTARVQAEDQARQRQAEMAHVARLGTMGEMAAGLAHELNQPLSAIINYTQACLERIRAGAGEPGELLDDLEQAATQAERAGEIVEHVRMFVGKGESLRIKADLNDLVRTAAELLGAELRRNAVQLRLTLADSLPLVEVVPIQIEQVVVNLIQNGLEAMASREADGPMLVIQTASDEAGLAELVIRDTGPGLPADVFEQVFDAFFTTKSNGTGMGLSISRSIIEAHGGRLWAAPDSGQGATFRFTLPAAGGDRENEC